MKHKKLTLPAGSSYNASLAERAVMFIQMLKHTKGEWHGKNFKLLPWQDRIIRDLFGTVKENGYRQYNTAYIEVPKKMGKQLALDTLIPTPNGFTTMGELKKGDFVFDESGKPCRVVALSEIDDTEKAYKIIFRNGETVTAGARHLWNVEENHNNCESKLLTTGEMYDAIKKQIELRIRAVKKNKFHYIADIIPTEKVLMRCIQVDSKSRQYLVTRSMIPTHNSELAAAVALYLLAGDGEWGAEVYGCAADRAQASIVFDVACHMVEQCPPLRKRIKPILSQKRLVYLPQNSFYQVLSAESYTKHGLHVHGVIFDEIHAQPNRALYDVMLHGSGDARRQPLYFLITTAGTDRNSICWEVHSKADDILKGRKKDPSFYPVIYGIDDNDDWTDEKVWYKANPSLDVTVDIEKLRAAFQNAKENPAEENLFRQLRLNQWVKQSVRWMPMDKWDNCAHEVDIEKLKGRECYGGLDLSSTTDVTAFVLVFPPTIDDEKYYVLPYFWLPEETLDLRVRRDHVPYDVWRASGSIMTTEGNVVHYGFIEHFIDELNKDYNIKEIAFDRWGAVQMTQNLEGMGFTVVPFGQGYKDLSPPTKELMKLVLEGKIAHGGNEPLRWMMDNIFIKTDPAGNIKPDKEKSTEKIDGAVATIMALDRAIRNSGNKFDSVYNERGIFVI